MLLLDKIMEDKGMTGKELSSIVGTTEATISSIRKGKRNPSHKLLIELAKALDVDVRELFKPTKVTDASETIYVKREGQYLPVGKLDRSTLNHGS